MKSGNGIPARCVYLEEMAADLDDQDWLDMDNVEQVRTPAWAHPQTLATGLSLFPQNVHMMYPKSFSKTWHKGATRGFAGKVHEIFGIWD